MIALSPSTQQTDSSCGPAVIQMLLGHLGKKITQQQFIEAANIQDWIEKHGTQPEHMIKAVSKLAPNLQMWFKNKASVEDLIFLVNDKSLPVAINWQGLFYDSVDQEPVYPNPENGHYSIVIDINKEQNTISLQDPYPGFAETPRTFPLDWFVERWWDIGEKIDPLSNKKTKILTHNLLFIVLPATETFPIELGMSKSADF